MPQPQLATYDTTTAAPQALGFKKAAQADLLISGILHGASVEDAGRAAGLGRSASYALLARDDVRDQLTARRADALAAATKSAAGIASEAVEALATLMRSAKSEAVRLRAADSLLSHASALTRDAAQAQEIAELAAQVSRLS